MIFYRYCPRCATPLVARAIPAPDGPERRVCPACAFIQWGNSKASASAIVDGEGGRILLSRRAEAPFQGLWDIPGGFLESGEHPEDGVRREITEETGLTVVVVRLIGVYMDTYGPPPAEDTLNFYYVCRVTSGLDAMEARDDVSELAWFDPRDLPAPIAFANANAALRDWLRQEGITTV